MRPTPARSAPLLRLGGIGTGANRYSRHDRPHDSPPRSAESETGAPARLRDISEGVAGRGVSRHRFRVMPSHGGDNDSPASQIPPGHCRVGPPACAEAPFPAPPGLEKRRFCRDDMGGFRPAWRCRGNCRAGSARRSPLAERGRREDLFEGAPLSPPDVTQRGALPPSLSSAPTPPRPSYFHPPSAPLPVCTGRF